jgi:chitinase
VFPGWVKLVRTGVLFEAFQSVDGSTWLPMGSDAIPMGNTVYVGMATTSRDATARTEAVLENFSVVPRNTTTNQPPTVAITSPANASTLSAGTNLTVTAAASDSDGTIVRVDFYAGTTLIGSDTSAPYTVTWPSIAAGTYGLKAVAYDDANASASSAVVSVTVTALTTGIKTGVMFQKSADHDTLVTSYELRIFASGVDPRVATPLTRSNLGKPSPAANGDITVDRSAFFSALAPGSYVATVAAIGTGGSTQSPGVPFTR